MTYYLSCSYPQTQFLQLEYPEDGYVQDGGGERASGQTKKAASRPHYSHLGQVALYGGKAVPRWE